MDVRKQWEELSSSLCNPLQQELKLACSAAALHNSSQSFLSPLHPCSRWLHSELAGSWPRLQRNPVGLVLFAFQMIIRDDLDKIQVREVLFIQTSRDKGEVLKWDSRLTNPRITLNLGYHGHNLIQGTFTPKLSISCQNQDWEKTQGPDQESVMRLLMSTHTHVRTQFSQHVSHLAQAILISFKGRDGHPQTRVCSTQAHSAGTRLKITRAAFTFSSDKSAQLDLELFALGNNQKSLLLANPLGLISHTDPVASLRKATAESSRLMERDRMTYSHEAASCRTKIYFGGNFVHSKEKRSRRDVISCLLFNDF